MHPFYCHCNLVAQSFCLTSTSLIVNSATGYYTVCFCLIVSSAGWLVGAGDWGIPGLYIYTQHRHSGGTGTNPPHPLPLPRGQAVIPIMTSSNARTNSLQISIYHVHICIASLIAPICCIRLKGPKLEIVGSGVFTQIRPVWIGDLGTKPKNLKIWWYRTKNRQFVLFSDIAKKV
jgi:hypothetical protein